MTINTMTELDHIVDKWKNIFVSHTTVDDYGKIYSVNILNAKNIENKQANKTANFRWFALGEPTDLFEVKPE